MRCNRARLRRLTAYRPGDDFQACGNSSFSASIFDFSACGKILTYLQLTYVWRGGEGGGEEGTNMRGVMDPDALPFHLTSLRKKITDKCMWICEKCKKCVYCSCHVLLSGGCCLGLPVVTQVRGGGCERNVYTMYVCMCWAQECAIFHISEFIFF